MSSQPQQQDTSVKEIIDITMKTTMGEIVKETFGLNMERDMRYFLGNASAEQTLEDIVKKTLATSMVTLDEKMGGSKDTQERDERICFKEDLLQNLSTILACPTKYEKRILKFSTTDQGQKEIEVEEEKDEEEENEEDKEEDTPLEKIRTLQEWLKFDFPENYKSVAIEFCYFRKNYEFRDLEFTSFDETYFAVKPKSEKWTQLIEKNARFALYVLGGRIRLEYFSFLFEDLVPYLQNLFVFFILLLLFVFVVIIMRLPNIEHKGLNEAKEGYEEVIF